MVTVITIAVVATSTYSWLKENSKLDGKGLKLQLEDSRGIGVNDAQYYKRDGIKGARNVTDSAIDTGIDMTEYDMIFTDRNVDTPIIIRVALEDVEAGDQVRWSVQCGDVSETWVDENDKMLEYYSNILTLRVGTGTHELNGYYVKDHPETNPELIYDGAVKRLSDTSVAEPMGFATESETGSGNPNDKYKHEDKIDELSGYIDVTDDDLYPNPDDGSKNDLIVYIELSYNSIQVASFMEDYEIGSEDKESIDFESDLTALRFTVIGKESESGSE